MLIRTGERKLVVFHLKCESDDSYIVSKLTDVQLCLYLGDMTVTGSDLIDRECMMCIYSLVECGMVCGIRRFMYYHSAGHTVHLLHSALT